MHNEAIVKADELFARVKNESALSHDIIGIPVKLERRLYIESWNGFEHDLAVEAGVALRRDTATYLGPTLPRVPHLNECRGYYRDIELADEKWFAENIASRSRDYVTVTIPITYDLLATLDQWGHWTLVELGRYVEKVIRHFHESMGDGDEKEIREEWELTYPDCV